MDGSNPLIADDKQTDEQRLELERKLREQGLNFRELSSDEARVLSEDMRGSQEGHEEHDDGEDRSSGVTPEEADGND